VKFSIEQRFNHDADTVLAALTDPGFISAMAGLPKLGRPELLMRDERGTHLAIHVRYAFVGELSGAVRRVVDPARLTWVEESTIDLASHAAAFRIVPDHYTSLLQCAGTSELTPAGRGSRRVTDGELRVSVPLVGGRVERAVVSGLQEHAAAEADLVDTWLAARPPPTGPTGQG
jgi:hypothetical protein